MTVEPSIPGYRLCIKCDRRFMSKDKVRLRKCDRCKKSEDTFVPKGARVGDVDAAIRRHFRGD